MATLPVRPDFTCCLTASSEFPSRKRLVCKSDIFRIMVRTFVNGDRLVLSNRMLWRNILRSPFMLKLRRTVIKDMSNSPKSTYNAEDKKRGTRSHLLTKSYTQL